MLRAPGPVSDRRTQNGQSFIEPLARLVLRGIARGQREIVYPRPLWIAGDAPALEARKHAAMTET